MNKATSDEFKQYLHEECSNPYGDGHSAERVLKLLLETKKNNKLLVKNLTY